jgi:hypothetical protein
MYSIKFNHFLAKGDVKVKVVATCTAILDYDIYGLTLTFLTCDEFESVVDLEYDKEFFGDVQDIAEQELLEEFYNPSYVRLN